MTSFTLRPYQQEMVDKAIEALTTKHPKPSILVASTGAGKSWIIAATCHRLTELDPEAGVLILQPSKEILEQNAEKLEMYGFDDIKVYSASVGRKEVGKYTMATIGSIKDKTELFKHVKYVLVDEMQECRINANGMYQKFFDQLGITRIVGLTATPFKQRMKYHRQGNALEQTTMVCMANRFPPIRGQYKPQYMWGKILYKIEMKDLQDMGYLCPIKYYSEMPKANLRINSTGGDYRKEDIEEFGNQNWNRILTVTLAILHRRPEDIVNITKQYLKNVIKMLYDNEYEKMLGMRETWFDYLSSLIEIKTKETILKTILRRVLEKKVPSGSEKMERGAKEKINEQRIHPDKGREWQSQARASSGNGESIGTKAKQVRGGSSHQWNQIGQQTRESRTMATLPASWDKSISINMSALREAISSIPEQSINKMEQSLGVIKRDNPKRVLVFAPSVKASQSVCEALRRRNIKADHVDGKTPKKQRSEKIAKFKSGETQVMCNCQCLTAGFDLPALDTIVYALPTLSPSRWMQSVGRGVRIDPNNPDKILTVFDLVGCALTIGRVENIRIAKENGFKDMLVGDKGRIDNTPLYKFRIPLKGKS